MARNHASSRSPSSNHQRFHRLGPLLKLFLVLYASNAFVMPNLLGHRVSRRMSLHAEGKDVAETVSDGVPTSKKLEDFRVGQEVEAVILGQTRVGTFCSINADKDLLLAGSWKLRQLLQPNEKVKAKVATIDLEKRRGTILIPDLEELVKDRTYVKPKKKQSSGEAPAQTQRKRKGRPVDPEAVEAVKAMGRGQRLSGKVAIKSSYGIWVDVGSAMRPKLASPKKLCDKLRYGEEVELIVMEVDVGKAQCYVEVENIETLVEGRPERNEVSTLEVGSVLVGHIAQLTWNTAFVDIGCVKEGRLMSPDPDYQLGQEVKVKVTSVDEENRIDLEPVAE